MRLRLLAFVSLTIFLTGSLDAQWVQTNGSPNGDPAQCIFASGSDLFAGTQQNLFLRSTDNGANWRVVDTLPFLQTFEGVAEIAGNDTNLFVSCYAGLFRSTDTGNHWNEIDSGLYLPKTGLDLLNSPIAIVDSSIFVGTANHGVFRSTDDGKSWFSATTGLMNGDIVYCFTEMGTTHFAGAGGVFISTNDGNSWDSLHGLPAYPTVQSLAVSGSNLFAGIWQWGIYRSTDTGQSWTAVNARVAPRGHFVPNIAASGTYLFVNDSGVFLSTNEGDSWTNIDEGLPSNFIYGLAVIGTNLYAGTTHGIWRRALSDFLDVSSSVTQPNSFGVYPNPTAQSTTISFSPEVSGYADISIVNPLGVEIAHLFSGELGAGNHSFPWNPVNIPDGMYECVVRMNGRVKMLPVVVLH